VWEPVALPKLPGRVVAASEPDGNRLAVWTTAGVFIVRLGPPADVLEQLPPGRGPEVLKPAKGSFWWRNGCYEMHGACGPGGAVVGQPLEATSPFGDTLERDGDRLLVRDIVGKVRQIDRGASKAPWSVAGFCQRGPKHYLLVVRPGSVRLFRSAIPPEGAGALWQRTGDPRQQRALLRAIHDEPDDDAPRLVYADWLEEHGDPDRAQFIRIQCRIARREELAYVPPKDRDSESARELVEANEDRWRAELPVRDGVEYLFFPQAFRGFPAVSFRTPGHLMRHGERLLAATPIEAVHFGRLPRLPLTRLLKTPWPGRVCRLTIRDLPVGAEPTLAQWLTSPQAGRLRRIKVLKCVDWTAVLRAVAESRHLGRLEEVAEEIWHHLPAREVVLALARSPHLPRLRYVSWGSWPEYPKETRAELKRRFPIIPLEKYD
jgi:uncharacterized protein (TIGR02996 family)